MNDDGSTQLLRGTLHLLILQVLRMGPRHGYGIVSLVAERTNGGLEIEDGALYQALHRMQERGWLDSEWRHADSGKRARFYWLTRVGERRLEAETATWLRYVERVSRVLQVEGA
jgi:PadR family transcriptional regulator, regulatory protein PadR